MELNFGYSPCPNDTFMFWAWAHGRLKTPVTLRPRLFDIQELNRRALDDAPWSLTKVSVPTYLHPTVRERYRLLSVGAALGRGCGPLLISKQAWERDSARPLRVAVPGRNTTAFYLAQMAVSEWVTEWVEMRYDEIMSSVLRGERVDAGVIIHESRFAYQGLGLHCAMDLGEWWESTTGLPLPLGVMLARRDLGDKRISACEAALKESIEQAWKALEREPKDRSLWKYLRDNAIELDDGTIRSHIELYVTEFSNDLGAQGRRALAEFAERAGALSEATCVS